MNELNAEDVARPLFVDLDHSLIDIDVTVWACGVLCRRRPWLAVRMPWWLAVGGRPWLKRRLADYVPMNPATLPFRPSVLEYLQQQRKAGRRLVLATACHRAFAQSAAEYLDLFEHVLASDDQQPCRGRRKLAAIAAYLQHDHRGDILADEAPLAGRFDYIGDTWVDMPLWEAAGRAMVVRPSARLRKAIEARVPIIREFW